MVVEKGVCMVLFGRHSQNRHANLYTTFVWFGGDFIISNEEISGFKFGVVVNELKLFQVFVCRVSESVYNVGYFLFI